MMFRKLAATGAVVAVFAAAPALAWQCPADMAAIDRALEQSPAVSEETLAEARELRNRGEELHEEGRHADSVAVLAEAKELLGLE